jgi:hypothetical protein
MKLEPYFGMNYKDDDNSVVEFLVTYHVKMIREAKSFTGYVSNISYV